MRKISVKVTDIERYCELLNHIAIELVDKVEISNNIISIDVEDSISKDMFKFIETTSIYLYGKYIVKKLEKLKLNKNYNKYLSNKKNYQTILNYLISNNFNIQIFILKLNSYFSINNELNETSYLNFNLINLGYDIQKIVNHQCIIENQLLYIKTVQKKIKELGKINPKHFEEVTIDFDEEEGIMIISNTTGEYITTNNVTSKLGIKSVKKYNDYFEKYLDFCSIIPLCLGTKVINIYADMTDLFYELDKNILFKKFKIKLNIISDN